MSRRYLTSGKVAKLLELSPKKTSDLFDSGILTGYRVPGKDGKPASRRVEVESVLRFARRYGLSHVLRELAPRILAVGMSPHWDPPPDTVNVMNAIDAATLIQGTGTLVVGEGVPRGDTLELARVVPAHVRKIRVLPDDASRPDMTDYKAAGYECVRHIGEVEL